MECSFRFYQMSHREVAEAIKSVLKEGGVWESFSHANALQVLLYTKYFLIAAMLLEYH
jgi:hypothetical protein